MAITRHDVVKHPGVVLYCTTFVLSRVYLTCGNVRIFVNEGCDIWLNINIARYISNALPIKSPSTSYKSQIALSSSPQHR